MGTRTRTDVLPYISLISDFGYLWPGTSSRILARLPLQKPLHALNQSRRLFAYTRVAIVRHSTVQSFIVTEAHERKIPG